MDFPKQFFEKYGTRAPGRHNEHGWHATRTHHSTSHDEPWHAHAAEREHGEHYRYRGDPQGRSGLQGMLGVLAQHKALLVIGAVLLLVVGIGGILAVVLLLPLVGALIAVAGASDLATLLVDLPRLLNTLLVGVPRAVLDYLPPLRQLKSTLEGKA